MARDPRVYEIAIRHGADLSVVMRILRDDLGEYVSSSSSRLVPPVARKLAAALTAEGYFAPALPRIESASPVLHELPQSAPSVLQALGDGDEEVNRHVRRATQDRAAYYLAGPAAQQVTMMASPATPIMLSPERLHTRTGVLIVQPTPKDVSVYAWIADEDALRFQTLQLAQADDSLALTSSDIHSADILVVDGAYTSDSRQFGEFCAVWNLVPETSPRPTPATNPVGSTKPRTGPPAHADVSMATLSRPRNPPAPAEHGHRESRPATYRWMVSGHYREQPYPSLGITKRIWIEPHTSGARDGELVASLRVFVISPS